MPRKHARLGWSLHTATSSSSLSSSPSPMLSTRASRLSSVSSVSLVSFCLWLSPYPFSPQPVTPGYHAYPRSLTCTHRFFSAHPTDPLSGHRPSLLITVRLSCSPSVPPPSTPCTPRSSSRDLLTWYDKVMDRITEVQPARDVADAEARLASHHECRMTIDAQQGTVQVS